ncbi:MAG: ABC transporter permease [Gammaproteobacteria bacterium]|nr:ABC transporter permease [Gammaproteobacteria bacterium]
MLKMLLKRLMWLLVVLFSVQMLTFVLFFGINTPDDIARAHLGSKYISDLEIQRWKKEHAYDLPVFVDVNKKGFAAFRDTLLMKQMYQILSFNLGYSLAGKSISSEIKLRVGPSLAFAIPAFFSSLLFNIFLAGVWLFFRQTRLNQFALFLSICFLSISTLFYIIFLQYLLSFLWKWFPISGFEYGFRAIFFVGLPIIVHIFAGAGAGAQWYRMLLMEEIEQLYVRTAHAHGLSDFKIIFVYALRNALIPIVTGVVVLIPALFLGSLLFESFFSIPGMGNYLISALSKQDFAIVQAMVLLGSLSYMIGLILTDLVYLLVDPRVRTA